jgi:hypothetical protein
LPQNNRELILNEFNQKRKFSILATASVARAFSANLDALTNNTMSNAFLETFPLNSPTLSPYVDFFCMAITLALAGKVHEF